MTAVKTIGKSGQIALGKEHAGKQVVVDQVEPGVWLIKLGEFVPDSERWLFQDRISSDLDEAVSWAENNAPRDSDLDSLENRASKR